MVATVGIVGLGVMGRNLALNARDSGLGVVATDSWQAARAWSAPGVEIAEDVPSMLSALSQPRVVLLMVKAGDQVDVEVSGLLPHLVPGDVVIDGGNSHYRDTVRRATALREHRIEFVGLGVSGGAEGARNGAALMAGCSEVAWEAVRPFLLSLAAKADDGSPTLARFGEGGAGHFVKMVHNGIEYAIMQAIAEVHGLLTGPGRLEPQATADLLAGWNASGRASGFLLEITSEIVRTGDPTGDGYLLDKISDVAGQKGTGAWSIEAALAFGAPVPSIMEAVGARQLSGQHGARTGIGAAMAGRGSHGPAPDGLADDLQDALVATMLVSLSQGLHLYAKAAAGEGWQTDLPDVLRVWRAGSILRMDLLEQMARQLDNHQGATDPLAVPEIAGSVVKLLPAWRRAIAVSVAGGYPAPVLGASLAYVEALGASPLPTALVQAQRDRFGAHGFGRTDRDGVHHGPWIHPDQETGG